MPASQQGLSLSGPQIDEIASGQPTAATLELLNIGQATLRRVLLWSVLRRLGEPANEAIALLGTAAATAPEAVEEIVVRPFAHDWGLRALAADRAEALADVIALATAAAIRAGLDVETALTTSGDALHLPGLGVAEHLHCGTVTVRQAGGVPIVGCPHPGAPVPRWRPTRTITLAADWSVVVEDHELRRSILGPPQTLAPEALQAAERSLRHAWAMIETDFPGYARTVRHLLRAIVALVGDETKSNSSSSPIAGGCIAMDLDVPVEVAAHMLIHETQHLLLAAANDLTPFCVPAGRELFRAPWKHFPRTAPAMLQGVFAHSSVIDYWLTRWHADPDDREARWNFAYLREVTTPSIGALRGSPDLTAAGRRLVDGLLARTAVWAGEAVPDSVARLAAITGRAEAAQWHLGNLRVTPTQAEELAYAYRSKTTDRIVLPDRNLIPEPPKVAPLDGGLIMKLHAEGRGREPEATAGPDLAEARRAVIERPAADEPWIALAAATPEPLLSARPELVRAVLLALVAQDGAVQPAPDQLAGWLSAVHRQTR
jgi:HEXXH motif-containing protein